MKCLYSALLLLFLCYCGRKTEETVDIKTLLEKESATWRSGDEKAHAACWYIQPYSRILVSLPNGKTIDVPPANMVKPEPGSMGKGGVATNSNYKFGITGNTALVSHDEESVATDGKKTYSYEMRMLEKINGQWKLVSQSIPILSQE